MAKAHLFNIHNRPVKGNIAVIQHRQHTLYHIDFNNGYSNNFYRDVENGKWVEEDLGCTDLAVQVGDISMTQERTFIHVPKKLQWHNIPTVKPGLHFGFYKYQSHEDTVYDIYHVNKKFLFSLIHSPYEGWQALATDTQLIANASDEFLHHVLNTLEQYAEQNI